MAVVERNANANGLGTGLDAAFCRLSQPSSPLQTSGLRELKDRVQQELRDWNIQSVTLLATTKYAQWKYADACSRVLSISAVMFAAAEADLYYAEAKPTTIGKYLLSPQLKKFEATALNLSASPKYWTTGGREAYATAAYGARVAA